MRPLRIIGALVAGFAVLAGLVVSIHLLPDDEARPFAYSTETELVIVRGDKTIARIPRLFDPANPSDGTVAWTLNGRHVAVLSDTLIRQRESSTTTLLAIDSSTGAVSELPCPNCYDIAAAGEGSIFAASWSAVLVEFDLAASQVIPRPDLETGLPANESGGLLVGSRTSLLMGSHDQRNTYNVRAIAVDGSLVSEVAGFDTGMILASDTRRAGQAPGVMAFATRPNPGGCAVPAPLWLIDDQNRLVPIDTGAFAPAEGLLGSGAGAEITDVRFDAQGNLSVSVDSWTCDSTKRAEDEKKILDRAHASWTLGAEGWFSSGGPTGTTVRNLGDGRWVTLTVPVCAGRMNVPEPLIHCNTGRLETGGAGDPTTIAEGVIGLSAPPVIPVDGSPAPAVEQVARRAECFGGCRVTGTTLVQHPTWGPTLVGTTVSGDRAVSIVAVDSEGSLRWRRDFPEAAFTFLAPVNVRQDTISTAIGPLAATDAIGHVFFNYNPGQHNGIVVLQPSSGGFLDFGSLPGEGQYAGDFSDAELSLAPDGSYRIIQRENDCIPSCADGTSFTRTFRWDGHSYSAE